MARQSPINWKRSDYGALIKAVNKFNKEVEKLMYINPDANIPERLNYKDVRKNIYTRREYNRVLKSLGRFSNEKEQEIVKTKGGYELTRWQRNEINRAKRRAERRLESELYGLEAQSSFGTGNTRLNEIKSTLESYSKLSTADPEDYKRISGSVLRQGVSDYDMKKASIFQENFIKAYKKMGRKEIVRIAKRFKNPMDFWEKIKDSNFADIKMKYDEDEGLIQFGENSKDDNYIYDLLRLVDELE